MGWADEYIATLGAEETVEIRPHGVSMAPVIKSGDLCIVEPVDPTSVAVGDIVLCRVMGWELLHLVKAIEGDRYQIGNNHGVINGWTDADSIFGRLASVASE